MNKITPLLRFLRSFPRKADRKAFALKVGTTEQYLYQLAAQPRPNPQLLLALALVRESKLLAKKHMTPPLTLEDLLVGTSDEHALVTGGEDGAV
jgi:hypothetical protein